VARKPKKSTDRSKVPAPSTEGQRLICNAPGSLAIVAAAVGVDKSTVGLWRAGQRVPNERQRLKLSTVYGIPAESWGERPGSGKAPAKPAAVVRASSSSPAAAVPPDPGPAVPVSTLEAARKHLADLEGDLSAGSLLPSEVAKIRGLKTAALVAVSKLEELEALREERIVESPAWLRIRRCFVEALRPFPEASLALQAALGAERWGR